MRSFCKPIPGSEDEAGAEDEDEDEDGEATEAPAIINKVRRGINPGSPASTAERMDIKQPPVKLRRKNMTIERPLQW